ncbi:MAG: hydrolase, partial [Methyloprofundus sp.]|nr:hydrolase [Methyloprofundus sp.]
MFIKSKFKAAWWLNNPHLQTLFPALLRQVPTVDLRRERLTTDDNDFIDIDFCGSGDQPLVILLHGLTGSAQSKYILGLQHALLKQGLRSAALNFRGCSGEYNHSSRCYHSGETGDIDFLYRTLR